MVVCLRGPKIKDSHRQCSDIQFQVESRLAAASDSQAEIRESTQVLWDRFSMALKVMYALLAITFGGYDQPLIVMGVITSSGVVVNDSLIMIDYANKKRTETSTFDAIHEVGLRRFRPIILTRFTTFGGLTPTIL